MIGWLQCAARPTSAGDEEVSMQDKQLSTAEYLEVINEMTAQPNKLRYLMNDGKKRLTGADAKYLVGGQLTYLAEKLSNLATELEQA